MPTSIDPVAFIRETFGIELKRVGSGAYAGPCPFCGGRDRFHVWERGNYWCRPGPGHCGKEGWIDQLAGATPPTEEERLRWRIEALERKQREQEHRLSALEKMAKCTDHLRYHRQLNEQAREYWYGEGIYDESIEQYKLGYCRSCPTDREHRPSYTIPIIEDGTLLNIRHRLCGATEDKYRPHVAGLGIQLFSADSLNEAGSNIIVTEGEKKCIVLNQHGFGSVGIIGKRAFKREWLGRFSRFGIVHVALDPDAKESAERLAGMFGGRGRVVDLPAKIDDMITRYGASYEDVAAFLRLARPMRGRDNGRHG